MGDKSPNGSANFTQLNVATEEQVSKSKPTSQLNIRAIGLMVLSMLGFAIEDMFIKVAAEQISVGQILLILGAVGGTFYALMALARGEKLTVEIATDKLMLARSLSDVMGAFGFVMALALIPLSNASAILQATPLVITMAAALLLGEHVGWRRWTAVLAGFVGVLLIIKPGSSGFDANSIFAIIGVLGLAGRDLITRYIPQNIPTSWISAQAFWGGSLLGLAMLIGPHEWYALSLFHFSILMIASAIGIGAYLAITVAARIGEPAAIAPFRYSRLIFALIIGYWVFGERPDIWMLAGSAIVIATGIYAIYREHIVSRRSSA